MIAELETLTAVWRGDETEIEALQLLARLYTEEQRYRDAFHVMRTALLAHPEFRDDAPHPGRGGGRPSTRCSSAGKGDALPAIEALSLFYDFRELTPIGRRGDEMIRRLADRLVAVDLLDQAAELLQHQVDHRLQGAARAQVATRLAVIYLMNRKPDRALAALRATRIADLSNELRNQRLLLEARALSDIGRHDLALEVDRQYRRAAKRSGCAPTSCGRRKRWREAAEQIELLLRRALARVRRRSPTPSAPTSCAPRSAMRSARTRSASARLREKYAAKMADGPDRRAFEVVDRADRQPTAPNSATSRKIGRGGRYAGRLPARHARALSGDRRASTPAPPARPAAQAADPTPRPIAAATQAAR